MRAMGIEMPLPGAKLASQANARYKMSTGLGVGPDSTDEETDAVEL